MAPIPEHGEPEIIRASLQDIEIIQNLWSEYWDSLGLPADFQGFGEEHRSLPGAYAPPQGCLLLVRMQGSPAGTAAFRPLSPRSCEAKRLYVRPSYRGYGLGRALLVKLIEEARAQGYEEMYCDTLKSMTSALRLYNEAGFSEVAPYSASPTPGAIFLKLLL
jgi:ribosomal protein S18 acetylase RimI-like enzyme